MRCQEQQQRELAFVRSTCSPLSSALRPAGMDLQPVDAKRRLPFRHGLALLQIAASDWLKVVRTHLSEEMLVPIITTALTDRSQPRLYKPNLSTTSEEFSGGAGAQPLARSSSTFTCDQQARAAPIGFALADRS